MKNELTVEQSAQLIELGVNPKLASGSQYVDTKEMKGGIELPPVEKPVFRLSDILAILPKEIDVDGVTMHIVIDGLADEWQACYYGRCNIKGNFHNTELIDALYLLLCWVRANGYSKPKTEEK